jgi:PiT family inorganic phosphate transporter
MQADSNRLDRQGVSFQKMIHWNTRGLHISLAFAIAFVLGAGLIASLSIGGDARSVLILVAACACGYMALNIGANDVANNLRPSFGSGVLSFPGAVGVAIIFSSSGALLAGDGVILTLSRDIVNPVDVGEGPVFIFTMIAALIAAAVWLNIGNWLGFQVSTTHSITGALLGAAITAAGVSAVDWDVVLKIVISWFASPVIGGAISAMFVLFVEHVIFSQVEILNSARRWIPVSTGIMVAGFILYLMLNSHEGVSKPDLSSFYLVGAGVFVVSVLIMQPLMKRMSMGMLNRRNEVNNLFRFPLILSAALLSFAHGANDVANAVGPLSAIIDAITVVADGGQPDMPVWVMIIGVSGIGIGLALFATKLVRNAAKPLSVLDQSRAFCACLAAAITVTGASLMGLPVSSTYTAIGAILGVALYREIQYFHEVRLIEKKQTRADEFRALVLGIDSGKFKPQPRRRGYRKLVRRTVLLKVVLAWAITLPVTAAIASGLLLTLESVSGY